MDKICLFLTNDGELDVWARRDRQEPQPADALGAGDRGRRRRRRPPARCKEALAAACAARSKATDKPARRLLVAARMSGRARWHWGGDGGARRGMHDVAATARFSTHVGRRWPVCEAR
eukprot:5751361-Prymnesium_polylepis.2